MEEHILPRFKDTATGKQQSSLCSNNKSSSSTGELLHTDKLFNSPPWLQVEKLHFSQFYGVITTRTFSDSLINNNMFSINETLNNTLCAVSK